MRDRVTAVEAATVDVVGAMSGASRSDVTARVSGQRLSDRGRLFFGQGAVPTTSLDRFRVDPCARSSVKARQDPPIPRRIEQRECEALVTTCFFEWVVADQPDPLERPTLRDLKGRRPLGQSIEFASDLEDRFQVRIQDGLEAAAFFATGDAVQPEVQPACPPCKRNDGDDQDDDDRAETDDDLSEMRLYERVEVDPRVLRWGSTESSRAPVPGR